MHRNPCGSRLASDGVVSGDIYVSDKPLSLASQLPQVLYLLRGVKQPAETAADTGSATVRCAGGTIAQRSSHRRNRLHS
ncbi:hypothetical protein C1893_24675 [Pseudomonas sp. MPR-ANC1]|nr:hypothetical protein C1893_24675 [Pseudomonas sp. MPR-ANC1]